MIASSDCFPPSDEVTLISSFGVSVGKKHQRLWPEINAFQADVPNKKNKHENYLQLTNLSNFHIYIGRLVTFQGLRLKD